MRLIVLLLVIVSWSCANCLQVDGCVVNTTWPDRLPLTVIPSHYQLNLTLPSPNDAIIDTFEGTVDISVTIVAPTTCVVLHARNLNFNFAYLVLLTPTGPIRLPPPSVDFDPQNQF